MANNESRIIKELLEIIKNKVGKIEARVGMQSIDIRSMKDQLSVLNEKLDGVQSDVTTLKSDLKKLNKKADGILEFLHNVDEDVHNHEERLKRIESVPIVASEL